MKKKLEEKMVVQAHFCEQNNVQLEHYSISFTIFLVRYFIFSFLLRFIHQGFPPCLVDDCCPLAKTINM